jgi:hypothetical protein
MEVDTLTVAQEKQQDGNKPQQPAGSSKEPAPQQAAPAAAKDGKPQPERKRQELR